MTNSSKTLTASFHKHITVGLTICVLLVGGLGGWAATAKLSGAVIAPGNLVVESKVKNIQHPKGGVVGQISVEDGDLVNAGDIVLKLDNTQLLADYLIVDGALRETRARMARLTAEQSNSAMIAFPNDLLNQKADPNIEALLAGETRLFELELEARQGKKAQLKERVLQLENEITGLRGQVDAKARETTLIQEELDGLRQLFEKGLVPTTRVKALEREETRLLGETNRLVADIAQAKGKVAEIELQRIEIDQEMRSEASGELADMRAKAAELRERRLAAKDALSKVEIRAPQNGTVHQLAAHTVGGVLAPGEVIMQIVPQNDALIVEASVPPEDIDQVHIGQKTLLRLSAFNQKTTPEIQGVVHRISANILEDERTGAEYFTVLVEIPESELSGLGPRKLVPGMPIEVFIQTPERTALGYLTKPLFDQIERAFQEE